MQIKELFRRLSYGELSNLSIGMEGAGDIAAGKKDQVLSHIEAVLRNLYTRFSHKTYYVKLTTTANRQTYRLVAGDPALSPEDGDTLTNNLLKIVAINRMDDPKTDRNEFSPQMLNHRTSEGTKIEFTSYDTLRFAEPEDETWLVEYRASHAELTRPVDEKEVLSVHPSLETALEIGVSARIYRAMNGEGMMARAQLLEQDYEILCARVSEKDFLQESMTSDLDRFERNGWV